MDNNLEADLARLRSENEGQRDIITALKKQIAKCNEEK